MRAKDKSQGYLTFAQGKQYLQNAYLLALSVKTYCDINDFTVVTDCDVPDYMLCAFDEVVHLDTLPVLITGGQGVDYGTFVLLQVYVTIRVTLQMTHSTGGCGLKIIYSMHTMASCILDTVQKQRSFFIDVV